MNLTQWRSWAKHAREWTAGKTDAPPPPTPGTSEIVALCLELDASRKEAKQLREHLESLTLNVRYSLAAVDAVMAEPETGERGRLVAEVCNVLDFENDRARRFALKKPLGEKKPEMAFAKVREWLARCRRAQGR